MAFLTYNLVNVVFLTCNTERFYRLLTEIFLLQENGEIVAIKKFKDSEGRLCTWYIELHR